MANQHTSPWTPGQDAELLRLFATHTNRQIGELLGKPMQSVQKQSRKLGLERGVKELGFTPEEHALVAKHYPKGGATGVRPLLRNRSLGAIRNHAHRHGIHYEPLDELELVVLRSLCAQGLSYAAIGRSLGKSKGSIQGLVATLGIAKVDAPKGGNKRVRAARVKPPKPERVRHVPLHLRPEIQQQVAAYVKEGRSSAYIGTAMELGKSTVQRTLAALGLTTAQATKAPLYRAGIRPPAPKPAPKPTMRVVRETVEPLRFQPKAPTGKKSPSKPVFIGEKTSDYLKGLPRLHPHQTAFERLTRPGQPRRDLRYKSQFLAVLEETTQPLQHAA